MKNFRLLLLVLCVVALTKSQTVDTLYLRAPENTISVSVAGTATSTTLYVYVTEIGGTNKL